MSYSDRIDALNPRITECIAERDCERLIVSDDNPSGIITITPESKLKKAEKKEVRFEAEESRNDKLLSHLNESAAGFKKLFNLSNNQESRESLKKTIESQAGRPISNSYFESINNHIASTNLNYYMILSDLICILRTNSERPCFKDNNCICEACLSMNYEFCCLLRDHKGVYTSASKIYDQLIQVHNMCISEADSSFVDALNSYFEHNIKMPLCEVCKTRESFAVPIGAKYKHVGKRCCKKCFKIQ